MYDLRALQVAALVRVNGVLENIELYYPATFEGLILSEGALWYAEQVKALGIITDYAEDWVRDTMDFIFEDRAWETLEEPELSDYYRKAARDFITAFHDKYQIDSPIDPLFTTPTLTEMQEELENVLRDNPDYFTTL